MFATVSVDTTVVLIHPSHFPHDDLTVRAKYDHISSGTGSTQHPQEVQT